MFIDASTILNLLSPFMGDRDHLAPPELTIILVRVVYKHFVPTELALTWRALSMNTPLLRGANQRRRLVEPAFFFKDFSTPRRRVFKAAFDVSRVAICFCCRSICCCCSLTALMSTTLMRSYLTPSTSPLSLRVTNNGSTLATSSAPSPRSRVPLDFQAKLIGRKRLINSRPAL